MDIMHSSHGLHFRSVCRELHLQSCCNISPLIAVEFRALKTSSSTKAEDLIGQCSAPTSPPPPLLHMGCCMRTLSYTSVERWQEDEVVELQCSRADSLRSKYEERKGLQIVNDAVLAQRYV